MQQTLAAEWTGALFPHVGLSRVGCLLAVGGQETCVKYKKLVDATRLTVDVPAEHTPAFTIADGVNFMPLNELPTLKSAPKGYVVIGWAKPAWMPVYGSAKRR